VRRDGNQGRKDRIREFKIPSRGRREGGGVTVNPTFSTFFFISYHFIVPHLNYVIQPKITYRGRRKRCYLLIHCLSVGFYFTPVDYLT